MTYKLILVLLFFAFLIFITIYCLKQPHTQVVDIKKEENMENKDINTKDNTINNDKNENVKSITFVEVMFYIFASLSVIYILVYGFELKTNYFNETIGFALTSEFFTGLISMVVNIFFGNLIMWLRRLYNQKYE